MRLLTMTIVNNRILSSLMTSTIELLVVAKAIVNSENKRALLAPE